MKTLQFEVNQQEKQIIFKLLLEYSSKYQGQDSYQPIVMKVYNWLADNFKMYYNQMGKRKFKVKLDSSTFNALCHMTESYLHSSHKELNEQAAEMLCLIYNVNSAIYELIIQEKAAINFR